jgi:hypothetical protein
MSPSFLPKIFFFTAVFRRYAASPPPSNFYYYWAGVRGISFTNTLFLIYMSPTGLGFLLYPEDGRSSFIRNVCVY